MRDLEDLRDALDVWHLQLTDTQVQLSLLSDDENERLARFRLDSKKTQFAAARSQLRRILADYTDRDPEELRFSYGEHGKPSLRDFPELQFNLSHSGTAGLLAITMGTPVGVDVEWEKPGRRFADIARRFFTPAERDALLTLDEAAQRHAFYRAWACKEAYLKAWGTGLSFPSNRFTIEFAPGRTPRLLATEMPEDRPEDWHLHAVRTFDGHAGAVCFAGDARWLRHFTPSVPMEGGNR